MWRVILIKRFFNNWMCVSNPQNYDFDYFNFDGYQRLINRQQYIVQMMIFYKG